MIWIYKALHVYFIKIHRFKLHRGYCRRQLLSERVCLVPASDSLTNNDKLLPAGGAVATPPFRGASRKLGQELIVSVLF